MNPTPTSGFDYSQYTTDAEITAKESYRIKDGSGGRGIFDPNKMRDIPQFQPSLGIKVIDIVMGRAGSKHPLVVAGKLQEGRLTHICWAYVHKNIGPNQDWFICLARTYGKPCPVCEHRLRLQADPDVPDETVRLYGSGKYPLGIYNIVHHLNPNQLTWQEPVMVWAINNSFMESTLQSMAKQPMVSSEAPTGYINYMWPTAGPQGGRHIKFEVKQKGQYFDYDGHQFIIRQNPIPPNVLQSAYCLDELLYVPEYSEVKDVLDAGLGQPIGGEPTGETFSAPSQVFGMPEPRCPFADYGGILGQTLDTWEECRACTLRVQCEAAMPQVQVPEPPQPAPQVAPAPIQAPQAAARPVPIPRRPAK